MGLFSKLFSNKKELRILMLGLDSVGKTLILYKLKLGEIITSIPTIGFNVETIVYKKLKFIVWDIGGQDKIRPLWRHYYNNTDGIIYVIDSADIERMDESVKELGNILREPQLKNIKLLILANKRDLPNIISIEDLIYKLNYNEFITQKWKLQLCCAINNDGIYEGLEWLSNEFNI